MLKSKYRILYFFTELLVLLVFWFLKSKCNVEFSDLVLVYLSRFFVLYILVRLFKFYNKEKLINEKNLWIFNMLFLILLLIYLCCKCAM